MSGSPEPGLSVVVITRNEARNIRGCLDSVAFAEERIVVDAESEDGTAEIAGRAGARVLVHPWDGYAAQRQRGFEAARHEWLLWLDADERLGPEAATAVRAAVAAPRADAYRLPRRHYFLGDWLRHGGEYPAPQLRLVHRDRARMRPELVHETVDDTGLEVGFLDAPIDHYSSPTVAARIRKAARYARLAAEQAAGRGSSPPLLTLLANPLRRTGYVFVRARGYRDGWRGALFSLSCGLEQALITWHLLGLRRRRT